MITMLTFPMSVRKEIVFIAVHAEISLGCWVKLEVICAKGFLNRKVEFRRCVYKDCKFKLFENDYSMLLHYLTFHKNARQPPLELLERSKGFFVASIEKSETPKDVEDNPKVVYLSSELRMIIDYKDSLIDTDELFGYRPQIDNGLESRHVLSQRHISKRFCGNLTVSRQEQSIPNVLGHIKTAPKQINTSETRFTSESKFNSRPIISNLNQPVDNMSDSDNDKNSLLIKRDNESWVKTPRKGSIDAIQSNKKIKRQGLRSADKKVSRRCTNLA